jgi:hypothetical protein
MRRSTARATKRRRVDPVIWIVVLAAVLIVAALSL